MVRLRQETGGDENPDRRVFGGLTGASLSRRLGAAAEAAGVAKRITAHSGPIGLAVELTRRGASTHHVMHAGHWKSAAMVAHYSAAARAESGAVALYMEPGIGRETGPRRIGAPAQTGNRLASTTQAGSGLSSVMNAHTIRESHGPLHA